MKQLTSTKALGHVFLIVVLMSPLRSLWAKDPLAWNDPGHRLTALIAYELMTPNEREAVIELLQQHPRFKSDFGEQKRPIEIQKLPEGAKKVRASHRWLFGQAAVWPDIARGFSGDEEKKYHRWTWHFINRPVAKGFWRGAEQAPAPASLVWTKESPLGTLNVVQALEMCQFELRSKKSSAANRAVLLCWYFHLIGDLHQPLHAASLYTPKLFRAGDKGGNLIKFGESMNLHRFWDDAMSEAFTTIQLDNECQALLADKRLFKKAGLLAKDLNFATWMNESHALALKQVYSKKIINAALAIDRLNLIPDSGAINLSMGYLTEDYRAQDSSLSKRRGLEAGMRLARSLKVLAQ